MPWSYAKPSVDNAPTWIAVTLLNQRNHAEIRSESPGQSCKGNPHPNPLKNKQKNQTESEWDKFVIFTAFSLFSPPFVQAQIKGNIKAPRHWPSWGESTDDQWKG